MANINRSHRGQKRKISLQIMGCFSIKKAQGELRWCIGNCEHPNVIFHAVEVAALNSSKAQPSSQGCTSGSQNHRMV